MAIKEFSVTAHFKGKSLRKLLSHLILSLYLHTKRLIISFLDFSEAVGTLDRLIKVFAQINVYSQYKESYQ